MNAYTNMYHCTSKEAELAAGTKFKKISAKIMNNNSSTTKTCSSHTLTAPSPSFLLYETRSASPAYP